ncbi:MAG: PIG-L family deacetylase, partial [Gemmatimonadaceae bacterium]|nr:PIG-L family deacetylase [Gemmatimonadaceae bacterium]
LLAAQERGAVALAEGIRGLGVTTRVLMIGAHPDDEDTQLITWLARGQRVETAYLSLTRGDGGQNIIGNELGDALGLIRTEELLAARRVDGGRQYFTRAYDFGFSKNAEETFGHWDRELLLRDVVSVVRAFRPHIIVSVFSGTPADGHGHHQVAGMLAREAFDLAGDTVRLPARATNDIGRWEPLKFYRGQRFRPDGATLRMNVGAYNPLHGRSYAEIAGESRSQHRSQAFGALQPRGVRWGYVRLEASRIEDVAAGAEEATLFDGIAPGWSRFSDVTLPAAARAALDSLSRSASLAERMLDVRNPGGVTEPLAAHVRRARTAVDALSANEFSAMCHRLPVPTCGGALGDLVMSLDVELRRAETALLEAAGVVVEANAARGVAAAGDSLPVVIEVYNRGNLPVTVKATSLHGSHMWARQSRGNVLVAPDSMRRDTMYFANSVPSAPWWLARPRTGAMFDLGVPTRDSAGTGGARVPQLTLGEDHVFSSAAVAELEVAGVQVRAPVQPIVFKYADPSKGEIRRPVAIVPAVTLLFENQVEYLPANRPVERRVRVAVQSASDRERIVSVALKLPLGLRADSASRTVTLQSRGEASVYFAVRGSMPAGSAEISAEATSEGLRYRTGFVPIEYEHIAPQQLYRPATKALSVVDVRLPPGLRVAYIPGVGDNVPPMLTQLGVPVTVVGTDQVAVFDFSRFTTVVVGPRAYETSDALVAANPRLLDFARRGGTVVVQYGQYEMMRPGMMPYPVTIARPHDRVTIEDAPVRILDPSAPVLRTPNAITTADFDAWIQERGLYMPRTFDAAYVPVLEVNDPGEPPNHGAILVAPVGRGTYVYTSLSFFRQLPAGVPGAARLFVNLLGAGTPPAGR